MAAPTPPPPRRRRGSIAVFVIFVAGALAVLPVFFLHPPARPGPPVLLIMATDAITATPSNVTVSANFGPFCSQFAWNPGTGILAVQADVDLTGAQGILVNHYDPQTPNIASIGGEMNRSMMRMSGGAWHIISAVDGRTLATLVPSGENVTVNGTTYARGAQWTMQFAYDVTTAHGLVRITESLTLANEGIVETRTVPVESCI